MTTKSMSAVQIKDAAQGIVEAVFSTFGVIDLDGDVTSKEAFTEGAPVVVSSYGHTSWDGDLPIGKGTIRTTDTEAIAELQFFLDTTHGRDAFETIKHLSEAGLQEWSYSLHEVKSHRGELDGQAANFIDAVTVKEVSPVLKGASIGTRTLSVKSNKFSEHAETVLAEVDALIERASEVVALRAEKGKSISDASRVLLAQIADRMSALKALIDEPTPTPPAEDDDARDALAAMQLRLLATKGATQ